MIDVQLQFGQSCSHWPSFELGHVQPVDFEMTSADLPRHFPRINFLGLRGEDLNLKLLGELESVKMFLIFFIAHYGIIHGLGAH